MPIWILHFIHINLKFSHISSHIILLCNVATGQYLISCRKILTAMTACYVNNTIVFIDSKKEIDII